MNLTLCALAVAATSVACEKTDKRADTGSGTAVDPPGIELPRLTAGGEPAPTAAPLLVASRTELTLDGTPVLALHEGVVAAEDKEGGALGMNVRRLGAKLTLPHSENDPLAIALDRALTYELLLEVMYSAKQPYPHWDHFALLARSGDRRVAIPLVIPAAAPMQAAALVPINPAASKILEAGGSTPIAATVHMAPPDSEGGDAIREKIAVAYLAGIKHCYKQLLRSKPAAQGKLKVGFTVTKEGRVANPTAQGVDPMLETCVLAQLKTYRFSVQRDAAGNAIESAFSVTLKMVTDSDAPPAPTDTATLAPAAAAPDPHADPKLIMSITRTDIIVWSISGVEGTLEHPLLKVAKSDPTAMAQLGKALAEVVQRRWSGGARPAQSRQIIFQAGPTESIQSVVSALAAIRATGDGKELFPDILLSSGFE